MTVNLPLNHGPQPSKTKQTAADKERIEQLRQKGFLYADSYDQWRFFLTAYEGGSGFANRENLFKHSREHDDDFADRVKRVHNFNYCEPLVDFFTNFIFSESIDRNGGPDESFFRDFRKNVNKKGDSLDDFMRQVCDDMQIFGMVYVLVDAPVVAETVVTKQQEQDLGIQPYWVLIKPTEITDWVVDEFENFLYVKRMQIVQEMAQGGSRRSIERYTEFYPDSIVISDIDITKPSEPLFLGERRLENTLGVVPIRVARYKRSKKVPFMGLSFLRDFAYNNRTILNLTSLLDEFLYRQAFNILVKQVDSNLPPDATADDTVVGSNNLLEYPKEANAPAYISPPVDPAKFIQDERARVKNEMFVRASQDALNEIFNGEKASGFSQAQSFSKTVPFISSRADVLEAMENSLMELTMKRVSKTWQGKIKYKDRYELTNLTDALTQFLMLVRDLQLGSEKFVKSELKRFVREYDGKLPSEVLGEIESQIEGIDFKEWSSIQKEALVGKGQSPGEQQKPKGTGTMAEAEAESRSNKTAATTKLKED